MGKLNYVKRHTSGPKLGSVVKKDVIKHSQSASKSRAAKDPHLEVCLKGKLLGDEGLEIACNGFRQALSSGGVKLDELNLAGNALTVHGLKALGTVIQMAAGDLKDLDLSGNELKVATEEEQQIWEEFLLSFRTLRTLRRLDLSNNPCGDKGLEIFWRVYAREPPIHLPRSPKIGFVEESVEDLGDQLSESEESEDVEEVYEQARRLSISSGKGLAISSTPRKDDTVIVNACEDPSERPVLVPDPRGRIRGLRSVPFLVVSQTGGSDGGALFLSYLVEGHLSPERLMPYFPAAKPGAPAEQLEQYQSASFKGIIYKPNELMSPTGIRLLETAETSSDPSTNPPRPTRRNTITAATSGNPFISELERARNKAQGSILNDAGLNGCRLWKISFKMLVLGRAMFLSSTTPPPIRSARSARSVSGSSATTVKSSGRERSDNPPREIAVGGITLPEKVCVEILRFSVDPEGIVSNRQCLNIIAWAEDRLTLQKEREVAGKLLSLQMWRILDGVGCLSYE